MVFDNHSDDHGDGEVDSIRLDGVLSVLMGLGGEADADLQIKPSHAQTTLLTPEQLEDLYCTSLPAERVCTDIPLDMLATGVKVVVRKAISPLAQTEVLQEEANQAKAEAEVPLQINEIADNYIEDTELLDMLCEASILASIYNWGAGVLLDVDDRIGDEQNWDKPVDHSRIKSVRPVVAFDGQSCRPQYGYNGLGRIQYFQFSLPAKEDIETARQTPNKSSSTAKGRKAQNKAASAGEVAALTSAISNLGLDRVHPDRVLWIEGSYMPPRARHRFHGSVGRLQKFWEHAKRYDAALQSLSNQVQKSEILHIARKNAMEMLAAAGRTPDGQRALTDQLRVFSYMANNLGVILSDLDNHKIDYLKRNLSASLGVIVELKKAMIAASDLTEFALFGLTTVSGGLSANDVRDRQHRANAVARRQRTEWRRPLLQFLRLYFLSQEGPTSGNIPEGVSLNFPSALNLSPMEEASIRSQQSQTDMAMFQLGLPGRSILQSRIGSGKWSAETKIMDPIAPPPPPQSEPGQESSTSFDPFSNTSKNQESWDGTDPELLENGDFAGLS